MTNPDERRGVSWRPVFSGFCALLVGIGLARFAYTPLIPALIEDAWFTPAQAMYLGAANLVGYLAGAITARRIVRRLSPRTVLRTMMIMATVAILASAFPSPFTWFFIWRFLTGFAGGVLMALAAPTILQGVPDSRRGVAGGVIFTGVGMGIAVSGVLVPLLLRSGLPAAWIGLGAMALILAAASWRGWPAHGRMELPEALSSATKRQRDIRLIALYWTYGLVAAALAPHMVFLVDFIARGLARGVEEGAAFWVLFGAGAVFGPVMAGKTADRLGFRETLRFSVLALAFCIGWPAFSTSSLSLAVSALFVGAAVPGVVPLVLGRMHELTPAEIAIRMRAWSHATVAFATGQAAGAYVSAFLFDVTGRYADLFVLGAGLALFALAIDVASDARHAKRWRRAASE